MLGFYLTCDVLVHCLFTFDIWCQLIGSHILKGLIESSVESSKSTFEGLAHCGAVRFRAASYAMETNRRHATD